MGLFHENKLAKLLAPHGMYVVGYKLDMGSSGQQRVTLNLHLDASTEKLGHRVPRHRARSRTTFRSS